MSLVAPTLRSDRLVLRPFADGDGGALFAMHSDELVMRWWDGPRWADPARAGRFLEACREMADAGTGVRVAVEQAPTGTFLGWCALQRWDRQHRSASLGYCFRPAAWGRGHATEASRLLLGWAFAAMGLHRVQALVDTRNQPSARVLDKLGFVREGTLREDCIVDGEISDSWVYGLLERDWRAAAGAAPRG